MILEGTSLIVIYIVLCICGALIHFLKKMKASYTETKIRVGFREYYNQNPYTTLIAIVSCIAAFLIFLATGQMNLALAFTTGYMCDSAADAISKRSIDRIE